jgi:hypothetical protein
LTEAEGRSAVRIGLSFLVLTFAWVMLVPVAAIAQAAPSGSAQYDQYDGSDSGSGDRVMHDAIIASGAIRATAEEAQVAETGAVSADEIADASSTLEAASAGEEGNTDIADLEKLPETGGPSPLWSLVPLLCVSGLLARRIF